MSESETGGTDIEGIDPELPLEAPVVGLTEATDSDLAFDLVNQTVVESFATDLAAHHELGAPDREFAAITEAMATAFAADLGRVVDVASGDHPASPAFESLGVSEVRDAGATGASIGALKGAES